jgi:cytochrome c biogenesis factor
MWVWVGGGIMALGGLLAAWPVRRRVVLSEPETLSRQLAGVQAEVR